MELDEEVLTKVEQRQQKEELEKYEPFISLFIFENMSKLTSDFDSC